MKTSIVSIKSTSMYYIVMFLSVLMTSCGSYQNSSYYDSDGIYGNSYNRSNEVETQNNQNLYKDYFGSLQNNNQYDEIFTDVDNYNDYNLESDTLQNNNTNYPGWGSNPQDVSINVYDTGWAMNNWYGNSWGWNGGYGWGMNAGYGWNNWYGNNWGWNGGFGWNNWYGNNWYGNNWYGNNWYGNNYYGNGGGYYNYQNNRTSSYNPGRRGSTYSNAESNTRNSGNYTRTQSTTRAQSNTISRRAVNSDYRGNNDSRANRSNAINRTSPTFSRNQRQPQNNSYGIPTRRGGNTNSVRQESNTPSRSYTPTSRSSNNSRSYSPSYNSSSRSSGNSGGGRSSGGGGGGRSSGGGGRGGRG